MPDTPKPNGLFIVDNSDADWKVRNYLHDWTELAHTFDIATGYFEIGALLALDQHWQQLDKIRILMGDEVSRRTHRALLDGIETVKRKLDNSIEAEKLKNDFLIGVPGVVEGLEAGKIECRVYKKDKFHAKAYITHGKHAVVGSSALVGSSNFTYPGLTDNVELNVQIQREVEELQDWYERHWQDAEDITPEILRVIERHVREYTPFEVYVKALQEYFRGHEMSSDEWELAGPDKDGSHMFPILDQYQREGYHALMKIARKFKGAFLCDGVGLGKTFVGLMLIERLAIHESKRVVLLAPKGTLESVWKPALRRYLPYVGGTAGSDFSNLVLFAHTDLGRGGEFPERFAQVAKLAHAVIIDEAHHFRNPGRGGLRVPGGIEGAEDGTLSRYWHLFNLIGETEPRKNVYMLTATPINNKLADLRHMIELFSRRDKLYFQEQLGIHSLPGHFNRMEIQLDRILEAQDGSSAEVETTAAEAQKVLIDDSLFRALVVQRSRAYAKESQIKQGASAAAFPNRSDPKVGEYRLRKTYGNLLDMVQRAFHREKPLFSLAIYYPLAYSRSDDIDPILENRQKQVVGLIRTNFLKRFESSSKAFERSCERLLLKLLAFATRHCETPTEKKVLERWKLQNADLIKYVHSHQLELYGGENNEEDAEEDIITPEMLEDVQYLDRNEYKVDEILAETYLDLDEIVRFLNELKKFKPANDDKLKSLVKLLKTDAVLKKHKVLIFTEFADTARYLKKHLMESGIEGVDAVDGSTNGPERLKLIERFAPYYNGVDSEQVQNEIRVLISTDVLSEGLNLQDCTRLINYDIHWNPVRLMQRIGRVDRRMDPAVEEQILADHPDQKKIRGEIVYWNFLPPEELNELLTLYTKVTKKTLRISKTLGIEGRKLLTPEDEYDALRMFNETYEGTTSPTEKMHLELQDLFKADPELEARLNTLPGRVFSGKKHPGKNAKAVFFCYVVPRPDHEVEPEDGEVRWTEEAGDTQWLLYGLASKEIVEDAAEIVEIIRSEPGTPRHCVIERETLTDIRKKIEKHLKNTTLKQLQAPVGIKPILKAWMELN